MTDDLDWDDYEAIVHGYPGLKPDPSPSAEQEQPMAQTYHTADLNDWNDTELLSLLKLYAKETELALAQARLDCMKAGQYWGRADLCQVSGFDLRTDPVLAEMLKTLVKIELERRGAPEVGGEDYDADGLGLLGRWECLGIEYLRTPASRPLAELIVACNRHFGTEFLYNPAQHPRLYGYFVDTNASTFARRVSDIIAKRFEQDDINRIDIERLLADITKLDLSKANDNDMAHRWLTEAFGGVWTIDAFNRVISSQGSNDDGKAFAERLVKAMAEMPEKPASAEPAKVAVACRGKTPLDRINELLGDRRPLVEAELEAVTRLLQHGPAGMPRVPGTDQLAPLTSGADIAPVRYGTRHLIVGDKVRFASGSIAGLEGAKTRESLAGREVYVSSISEVTLPPGEFAHKVLLTEKRDAVRQGVNSAWWQVISPDAIWEVLERGSVAAPAS